MRSFMVRIKKKKIEISSPENPSWLVLEIQFPRVACK